MKESLHTVAVVWTKFGNIQDKADLANEIYYSRGILKDILGETGNIPLSTIYQPWLARVTQVGMVLAPGGPAASILVGLWWQTPAKSHRFFLTLFRQPPKRLSEAFVQGNRSTKMVSGATLAICRLVSPLLYGLGSRQSDAYITALRQKAALEKRFFFLACVIELE